MPGFFALLLVAVLAACTPGGETKDARPPEPADEKLAPEEPIVAPDSADGAAGSGSEVVVTTEPEPDSAACHPLVDTGYGAVQLRPHVDAFLACQIDESTYRRLLAQWLAGRDPGQPPLASISLGRMVDLPWLSAALQQAARQDPRWDAKRGRPVAGEPNAYVAGLLQSEALRARLNEPFATAGWSVRAVSVEKVLVGPAPDDAAQRLPHDAQIWLVLADTP